MTKTGKKKANEVKQTRFVIIRFSSERLFSVSMKIVVIIIQIVTAPKKEGQQSKKKERNEEQQRNKLKGNKQTNTKSDDFPRTETLRIMRAQDLAVCHQTCYSTKHHKHNNQTNKQNKTTTRVGKERTQVLML